jgi:TRAP-type uncharacterized transport system substrate-binding protein
MLIHKQENFKNLLITQSVASQRNLTLLYDDFDLNDFNFYENNLKKIFPLKRNSKKYDFIMLPQSENLRYKDLNFVMSLYNVSLTLMIPISLRIDTLFDMNQLVIGTIQSHYSSTFIRKFVEIFSLKTSIKYFNSYDDLDKAWSKDEINSIFLLCSHPNSFIEKFSFKERIQFLDWDLIFADSLNSKSILLFYFPDMIITSIPIRTYRIFSLTLSISSYGFKMNILAQPELSNEYVYSLVGSIYENHIQLLLNNSFMQNISQQAMSYCPSYLQYHPGAKEFYISKNFITEIQNPLCSLLNNYTQCDEKNVEIVQSLVQRHSVL